jgi:hypothetical protein
VGIRQIDNQPLLSIFPNPASNYFNLQLEEKSLPQNVQIMNLQGQTVYAFQVYNPETRIDVSHLAKGFYIVKAGTSVGKLVVGN